MFTEMWLATMSIPIAIAFFIFGNLLLVIYYTVLKYRGFEHRFPPLGGEAGS
jgi:hypothetical protein